MRRALFSLFVSLLWLGSLTTAALAQAAGAKGSDISGAWILTEQFPGETHTHRMSLQVAGDKITGQRLPFSCLPGPTKIERAIADSVITMKWLTSDGRVDGTVTGKAQDGVLKGEGDWGGIKLQWSARRPATRPEGGPRTHTFTPTEFHRTFSYAIPPALRIFPGDTVKTKSVDAGGTDENSVRRSLGGNPLTGPFYVEGAMPGDTLVVKLNSVRTNRDWARSGQTIMGNALVEPFKSASPAKPSAVVPCMST